jgi:hypothetical protein
MRRLIALLVLPLLSVAFAADPLKKGVLPPPHELKLFDGESTFGWDATGDVTVKDGKLTFGEKASITFKCPLPGGTIVATNGNGASNQFNHKAGEKLTLPPKGETPTGGYKSITFTPDELKPLFTGKDLSGWKVFKDEKREKSKFEVTKDGEIRLTNGPGDLQTEGKYADFVLQLEFKTNGDGLNSGVFFRCIPDQYQNGYECQINNAAKGGDKNTPADGGTGAIYRRQPARKIVANDREWTHLTLIARGPTFATWVNGYPVCVWTDDRPKDENPRKGLRLDAGHLSIQGHDPTTDLLFRNIRLAEIKK